jgi:hypothetical protein
MAMTPAQALTYCRDQWAESSSGFFTDAELRSYLWDAESKLNQVVECLEVSTSITTVTGTQEYGRQSLLYIKRVTYDADKLKKIDYRELDLLDNYGTDSSNAQTGEPSHYYEHGDYIGLWPVPDTTNTLRMWGIGEPTLIASDTSNFSIPSAFHRYLPDYALMRMAAKDQDDGRVQFYGQLWASDMKEAQQTWSRRRFMDKLPVVKDEYEFPGTALGMK